MISLCPASPCAPAIALLLLAPPCVCAARVLQQQQSPMPAQSPQAQPQGAPRPQSSPQVYVPPFWGGSSGPVSTGLIAYVIGAQGRSAPTAVSCNSLCATILQNPIIGCHKEGRCS